MPERTAVLDLMHSWVQSESLRRHMYAVEAAMQAYARRLGEDEELWGATGLIHDFASRSWIDREGRTSAVA